MVKSGGKIEVNKSNDIDGYGGFYGANGYVSNYGERG